MEKIAPSDPETRSADLTAENIAQLKALFPEAFTEGKIDFDVLKQLLGGAVDDKDEKYGLNWHGKRRARQLALTPSTGTLRPCPEDSVDWDTTQNLMIEGDNLEVLKLLQKSYSGKVKLIYIDPPYNTGKDFVYPDDYRDNIKNYLELTGQVDGEGRRISSNTEASGRFHTDWLNMMYPRLKIAKDSLREDGFFVISIDDNELKHILICMNEIFGEENFVATLIFDRNRKNDAKLFSCGHEYMVVYAKNKAFVTASGIRLRAKKDGIDELREEFTRLRLHFNDNWNEVAKGIKEYYATFDEDDPRLPLARYTNVDDRGPFRTDGNPSWPGGGGPKYDVIHPITGKVCKVPSRGWVWPTFERMKEEIDKGNIIFGKDETTIPSVRMTLFENDEQVMRSVIFSYAQKATQDFSKIFEGKLVFDNPKSFVDLKNLICYLSEPGDLILDFFAGSGTTGHGVILSNLESKYQRHFILVQLPEPIDISDKDQKIAAEFCQSLGKPLHISEITKERLRRSSIQPKADNPRSTSDIGFRVFKLDSSNIRTWDPDSGNLEADLLEAVEHIKEGRTEADVLYELLLKLGLELTVPIETRTLSEKTVYSVGAGTLIVCLADSITRTDVEELAQGIVAWHTEQNPAGETTCVFRDSAFENDVAKTNLAAILEQHGLTNVRSL